MKLGLIHFRSCVVAVAYYQPQISNAKSYYKHGYGVKLNETMCSEDIQVTHAQLVHGAGCGYAN